MKKCISILVLLAFVAAGAFAADFALSAGGGALFDYSANNGVEVAGFYTGMRNTSIGGFVFFDATYVEANVSFAYGMLTSVYDLGPLGSGTEDGGSAMQLGLGLLGKYPIKLSALTLYPLVGINYNLVLSASDADGNKYDKPGDLSQFGVQFGVGIDKYFTDAVFLRAEGLFQLRFANKLMSDQATGGASTTIGMGPVIKVGVGYKF